MKKSPLSTPGCHTGNFNHQNRGRRGGYGYQQSRNNGNEHFHRYSRSNNSSNAPFGSEVIPLDSSSPVFYHKRGNRRQIFNRPNQRFPNVSSSGSDNQRNFQNNSGSPYQRNRNHFTQKNQHRCLPITEYIDIISIFEDPWAELEKDITNLQQSNSNHDTSIETVLEANNESNDTLSDSDLQENSTDMDNSRDGHESSVDLQLDGISFNCDSKNASM